MPSEKKNWVRDLRPEHKPLDEIVNQNHKLIELARTQIEQIRGSLKDLAQRIITEKPDMVVFLDKGARLMASLFFGISKAKWIKRQNLDFIMTIP